MTYALVLQTISTLVGMTGVGTAVYATFFLHRVRGAVNDQTEHLKQSIADQTEHLKASIKEQTSALAKPTTQERDPHEEE